METSLRQAESKVEIEGIVSEVSLDKVIRDGKEVIQGNVTVKTDENNFVQIPVYCSKFKKDGGLSKVYPGIETVMNEYKSIADVGLDNADKVRITTAKIVPYTNPQSMRTYIRYKTNFFNRVKGDYEPRATFIIELFVKSVVPEVRGIEGEETGRVKILGWMPNSDGIEPVELFVKEDKADIAISYFEPGNTYQFWGVIEATQYKEEKEISGGFGESRKEITTVFKNELICTGGDILRNPNDVYSAEAIKLAVQQREDRLKEERNKPQGNAVSANNNRYSAKATTGRSLDW